MLLSESEERVLQTFRQFLMTPNRMLCFTGPTLEQNQAALQSLTDKNLLSRTQFRGGYALTRAGFEAMNDCQ